MFPAWKPGRSLDPNSKLKGEVAMKTICTGCSRVLITERPCEATQCGGCGRIIVLLPGITGEVAGHTLVASVFNPFGIGWEWVPKSFEAWTSGLKAGFGVTAEAIVTEATGAAEVRT